MLWEFLKELQHEFRIVIEFQKPERVMIGFFAEWVFLVFEPNVTTK